MAKQGWYPDPGGMPGMFRYWDGTGWSQALSPTPAAPPPGVPGSAGYGSAYGQGSPYGQGPAYGQSASNPSAPNPYTPLNVQQHTYAYSSAQQSGQGNAYSQFSQTPQPKAKRSAGPWIILVVVVVVLALITWFIVSRIGGGTDGDGDDNNPNGNPTTSICPKMAETNERNPHPIDDRVYGGSLSYPMLGSPWGAVNTDDNRIPFGRDTAEQLISIHPGYDGPTSDWVASVMVGELYAGDGFYSPEQGSAIVNKCIFGTLYGDTEVTPETIKSEAYSLDGYDGWITVTNLTFSIPNLATTSELATVIIIKTSDMSSSIFYSSIPGDASQYNADVDQAIAGLKVEPS